MGAPHHQGTPEERSGQPAPPPVGEWSEALDELESNLRAAVRTFERLRAGFGGPTAPRLRMVAPPEVAAEPPPAPPTANGGGAYSPFERLWERLERERIEKNAPVMEAERHGLDLLPRQYLVTVEDKERTVDLVPLHRALQSLTGVEEVSLVSFANGVPVVSLRTDRELDPEQLHGSVGAAMDRECEVIPQDNGRIHLRLRPVTDRGG